MSIFYFGTSDRRMFGLYEPSAKGGRRGAVICSPWGQEYLMAHQSLRFVGQLIAESGSHVLRFDWYGSGDSGGDVFEGGEPQSWLTDLDHAIEELKALSEASKVSLIGLRLGATIAAMAAGSRRDVDRLVLWDPIFDGDEYVAELSHTSRVARPRAYQERIGPDGEETFASLGFPLTPAMREGMRLVRLESFASSLPPTLLVSTVEEPGHYEPLRQRLRDSDVELTDVVSEGPKAWVEEGDFGTSGMPVKALHAIAEWLR